MKKILTVLLLTAMVIGSANVYANQSDVYTQQDEATCVTQDELSWPKLRLKWRVRIIFNLRDFDQDCLLGDGFCIRILLGIGGSSDNTLGEAMPGEIGPTNDGRYVAVKVDHNAVNDYEDGNEVYRFKNKRSIYLPKDIYLPDEVWKKMGMDPITYQAGTYSLVNQDGAYFIMFPLQ